MFTTMFTAVRLNEILSLEKKYKAKLALFRKGDYENKVNRLIDNRKREIVRDILTQDMYKPYALFHNLIRNTNPGQPNNRQIIIDLHGLAIQDNRVQALKNINRQCNLYMNEGFIDDFCREIEAAFFYVSTPNIVQLKGEWEAIEQEVGAIELTYQRSISQALEDINSTESEQNKIRQLVIEDAVNGDTIGHCCLRDSDANKIAYLKTVLKLSSTFILRLLFKPNYHAISILDLFVKSNLNFIWLASNLSSDDLYVLLSKDNLFVTIFTTKCAHKDFIPMFFSLLKAKFSSYPLGHQYASQLLSLNSESMDPANNGWTFGHAMIKFADTSLLLEYLDFLFMLSKEKTQRRFNQPSLTSETFISLIIRRITPTTLPLQEAKQAHIDIVIKLLTTFDFDQKSIRAFLEVPGIKARVGNYLLNLSPNEINLNVLRRATDKHTSIGAFCWEWRWLKMSFRGFKTSFGLFSKSAVEDEPTIITKLRARIAEMSLFLNSIKCAPSAPPAGEYSDDTSLDTRQSFDGSMVVAQPILNNEAENIITAVAIIADSGIAPNSTKRPDFTNHQFILALLGACLAALFCGRYLWLKYCPKDMNDESDATSVCGYHP